MSSKKILEKINPEKLAKIITNEFYLNLKRDGYIDEFLTKLRKSLSEMFGNVLDDLALGDRFEDVLREKYNLKSLAQINYENSIELIKEQILNQITEEGIRKEKIEITITHSKDMKEIALKELLNDKKIIFDSADSKVYLKEV